MVSDQQSTSSSRFNRKKENIFARLINAIKKSTTKQKFLYLLILCAFVAILGVLIYKASKDKLQTNTVIPMEKQEIDQDTVDKALNQLQSDPSSIPSGTFMPEKGDYFMTDKSNKGNNQQ